MQRLATLLIAACALALTLVAIAPDQASAGWRRGWGYYGPGVGVYVGAGLWRLRLWLSTLRLLWRRLLPSLLARPLLAARLGTTRRKPLYRERFPRAISGDGDGPFACLNPCQRPERHMNGALSLVQTASAKTAS
jgi:hypothetical protein